MRRIKYLKSINKYLNEDTFKTSLAEKNYFTPIRNRYKGGPIDISKKICDLRTFSDEEIERMNEYCEKNDLFNEWSSRKRIEKTDNVNIILLWAKKNFFEDELEDNPYLYQTTAADITYTVTSHNGVLITKNFPSDLLDRKFGYHYYRYLLELKGVLLRSEWFEELQTKIVHRLSRDYFYEKIDNNRVQLIDMSDDNLVHIDFVRYIDRQRLFKVIQFDESEDGINLRMRIELEKCPAFEYTRNDILTEAEFKRTLEEIMERLYEHERLYKDREINLETYKLDLITILDQLQ